MPTILAVGPATAVRVSVLTCVVLLAALLVPAVHEAQARAKQRWALATIDSVESEIIRSLNAIRGSQGLTLLRADGGLFDAADEHSSEMLAAGQLTHDSPSGQRCDVRIRKHVRARAVGETISWLAGTPAAQQAERTVTLWLNSPPHRATLLAPFFRRIGVSRQVGTMFGRTGVAFTADLAG